MKANIYIDYETIPKVNLENFNNERFNLFIIGNALSVIDPEFTKYIDAHENMKFYNSKNKDHNSLLFLLCTLIGEHNITENPDTQFIIVSKNRNLSDVIKFMKYKSRKCRRLEDINITAIEHSLNINNTKEHLDKENIDLENVKKVLSKIKSNKRPRKINAIKSYIANLFKDYSNKDEIAMQVYAQLKRENFLIESANNNIVYNTDNLIENTLTYNSN
ncbi:MAG: hypothetical protein ACEPOV_02000 [Hyphomicrobiales bacterium]